MARLVRTLLAAIGLGNIQIARDGTEAFEALQNNSFDLMITDLAMRPIDGLEMTRMIRNSEDSPCPTIPIIMMTGHSERHLVEEARDAGANEFLCKPLTAQNLYQRIVSVVEQPRMFVRTSAFFGPDRRRRVDEAYAGAERRIAAPLAVHA
ncbi:MAG: two-component system response regulator [Robiginitomaculum sp.]|nr:MAG: two-component system response regulator [Robiginitomaculum sp.]